MKSMIFVAAALAVLADALPDRTPSPREWHAVENIAPRQKGKGVQQPVEPPRQKSPTIQGCYKSSGDMKEMSVETWNTIGRCGTEICYEQGYLVGGTMGGEQCWCGNTYPRKEDLVDDSECNMPCTGWPDHACGGIEIWTVYNTGRSLVVKHEGDDKTSSSSAAPTTTAPPAASSTAPEQEVTVSVTPEPSSEPKKGGTNVGGIAAGVVVGVIVIAAVIGGGVFYMRRKRNKEIEEEHRRNAAVNAFIGQPPGSSGGMSSTDSRLDPVLAHRRMSDGSIADNQDYSRRILRVTNA